MASELDLPSGYSDVLSSLTRQVRAARSTARRTVNTELISLYWQIGDTILQEQRSSGWGTGVVERLAQDLRHEFPDMTGFSRRNLMYMRSFAESWPGVNANVPQPVAHLPWGHIRLLLDKVENQDERDW